MKYFFQTCFIDFFSDQASNLGCALTSLKSAVQMMHSELSVALVARLDSTAKSAQTTENVKGPEPEKAMGSAAAIRATPDQPVILVTPISMRPTEMSPKFYAPNVTLPVKDLAQGQGRIRAQPVKQDTSSPQKKVV